MASNYKFSNEEMAAIKAARRETKDKRADARLKALELRAEGMELSEVSQATGFHAAYVSQLVAKYRDHGLEAISGNHYGGNHRNMSFEEEAAILAPFRARAEKGELVEISEIETAYQQAADARLKALELRAEGMELSEVSQATGFHAAYVSQLVAKYRDHGLEAISGNHYGGNHRNMSFEEEAAILAPFKAKAEKGELVEISEIETAYQQAVGHSIGTSQIYYVLHRHGWRKVMPRSRHPKKASEEVIETSKN